jgi:hypothetical protein
MSQQTRASGSTRMSLLLPGTQLQLLQQYFLDFSTAACAVHHQASRLPASHLVEGPECLRYKCFVEVIVQPYVFCA